MRLFIAINFGHEVKSKLLALCNDLRAHAERGRFSQPKNLHITLAFLGECAPKQITVIQSIIHSISFEPFDVIITHTGRFKRDGGDIWWAGIRENKTLAALQHTLANKLVAAGFELENRAYTPHITLGREVLTSMQPQKIEPFGETVKTIELMKSERVQGAVKYTAI